MQVSAAFVGRVRALLRRLAQGRTRRLALAAAIPALLLVRIIDPTPVEMLRLRTFDALQAWHPRATGARPVVIVDIDERSIAALGQWPWARSTLARLVDALDRSGVAAIGCDIVFAEPDRLSPEHLAVVVPNLDPASKARLLALPTNDAELAKSIHRLPTVLGQTALSQGESGAADGPWTGVASLGPSPFRVVPRFPAILRNLPILERAAAGRGLFTIVPERDGIVRRVPTLLAIGDHLVPSLDIEMLRVLTGARTILARSDASGMTGVALPHLVIATDRHGRIWIPAGRHEPDRYLSVVDILDGRVPPARLAGKIALIGTSAIGLLDSKTTPLERAMPGVEVHAQVLEGALTGTLLHEPRNGLVISLLVTAASAFLVVAVGPSLGPVALLTAAGLLGAALIGSSMWLYRSSGTLFDVTFPLMANLLVFALLAFTNYATETAQRRRIRTAFAQYLSPDLVNELCRSGEALTLGGETRRMSVLFSDVRGFTAIAEQMKSDPQQLTSLMNRLLTPLSAAIIANRGTVDKYMGDAVMAFWNAPLADTDHEGNACRAALAMLERLDLLNDARCADDPAAAPLAIGIGINTGDCVVGNMGSDLRFDYSVLGDCVNLASRLEGRTQDYGIRILLGDATARAVKDRFAVLEVDEATVKGKSEPQLVWTLVGDEATASSAMFVELARHHAELVEALATGRHERAAFHLAAARLAAPALKLEGLYAFLGGRLEERLRSGDCSAVPLLASAN